MRAAHALISAILITAFASVALAQGTSSLVGRQVMTVKWDVEFMDGQTLLYKSELGKVYTVRQVSGDWLWLVGRGRKGWVKRADVVRSDQAVSHFDRLVRQSASAENFRHRAMARIEMGDVDGAIADCNEAIRRAPQSASNYITRGNAWSDEAEFEKAIADYSEAIRLDPMNDVAYFNRGLTREDELEFNWLFAGLDDESDEPTKAEIDSVLRRVIADYSESIRLDPNYARAFVQRGNAYRELGEFDRAISDLNAAIRLDPHYAENYLDRGFAWRDKKVFDRAVADFSEAVRLDPSAGNYAARAYVYKQKGDYGKAIADLETAIRLEPTMRHRLADLALIYAACPVAEHRNGRRAVELATKACEAQRLPPATALAALAAAYAEVGDFPKAIETQVRAVELAYDSQKSEQEARLALYRRNQPFREPKD
jgi:tetratricopeptide (TPR) repeat protein